jgi:hypothetical protein
MKLSRITLATLALLAAALLLALLDGPRALVGPGDEAEIHAPVPSSGQAAATSG